jgi:hypothetical protein
MFGWRLSVAELRLDAADSFFYLRQLVAQVGG